MPGHDGLAALLDALAAMPASSRRAILGALSLEERDALAVRPAAAPDARPGAPTGPSPFSPWLASRIDALRDDPPGLTDAPVTAASRQALFRSLGGAGAATRATATPAPGRSLFDSFGGRLAARMGRP